MSESKDFFNPLNTIGRSLRQEVQKAAKNIQEHPSIVERHGKSTIDDGFFKEIVQLSRQGKHDEVKKRVKYIRLLIENSGTKGDGHLYQKLAQLNAQGVDTDVD